MDKSSIPVLSQLVESGKGVLSQIILFANPDKDFGGPRIQLPHQRYLVTPFIKIALVSAKGINPQAARSCFRPETLQALK
jgi:hypothetical protein